jgi:tRNA pseudouridine65 synthase
VNLPILYRDAHLVAIHKPPGLLMHRSPISRDEVVVVQTLRDQIGQRVYPVHRLDRATSGLVILGLTPEVARLLAAAFTEGRVEKEYLALARGWTADTGLIDHPVADEDGNNLPQAARTRYRTLARVEIAQAVDRYPTARYSLISAQPLTGRRQQIRKHFKHISHHLIGDTTHGNGRQNRFFRERFGVYRLMLLAHRLAFAHPCSGESISLTATPEAEWQRIATAFGWTL